MKWSQSREAVKFPSGLFLYFVFFSFDPTLFCLSISLPDVEYWAWTHPLFCFFLLWLIMILSFSPLTHPVFVFLSHLHQMQSSEQGLILYFVFLSFDSSWFCFSLPASSDAEQWARTYSLFCLSLLWLILFLSFSPIFTKCRVVSRDLSFILSFSPLTHPGFVSLSQLHQMQSSEPGLILFKVDSLHFCVSLNPNTL